MTSTYYMQMITSPSQEQKIIKSIIPPKQTFNNSNKKKNVNLLGKKLVKIWKHFGSKRKNHMLIRKTRILKTSIRNMSMLSLTHRAMCFISKSKVRLSQRSQTLKLATQRKMLKDWKNRSKWIRRTSKFLSNVLIRPSKL